MKKVVIPYFSNGIKYTTPLLGGGAAYLIFVGHPLWAGLLILLGAIILTTAYVTEIDPAKREYRDYLSVMGFAVDEERSSLHRDSKNHHYQKESLADVEFTIKITATRLVHVYCNHRV